MYSSFPKRDRIAIRVALSLAWFMSSLAGVGGILLTPATVQNEVGIHLPLISSFIVFLASAYSLVGVAINRYEWEWVGSWFTIGGAFIYVVTVWALVFTSSPTRMQQAASLSSLLFFYVYRIVACSAHARKLRQIHALVNTGEVKRPNA